MPAGKPLRRFAPLLLFLTGGLLWLQFRNAPYLLAARALPAQRKAARAVGLPLAPGDPRSNPPVAPPESAAPIYREIARALAASDVPGHQAVSNVMKRTRTDADRQRERTRLAALAGDGGPDDIVAAGP